MYDYRLAGSPPVSEVNWWFGLLVQRPFPFQERPLFFRLLASKIEAIKHAVEAHGSKLFINVRTDVYLASLVPAADKVDEVIRREKLYAAAGGNGLFVPVITNEEEIARIAESISLPLNVMAVPGLPNAERLAGLGVKRLSAGAGIPAIVWQTAASVAKAFLSEGDAAVLNEDSISYGALQQLFSIDN